MRFYSATTVLIVAAAAAAATATTTDAGGNGNGNRSRSSGDYVEGNHQYQHHQDWYRHQQKKTRRHRHGRRHLVVQEQHQHHQQEAGRGRTVAATAAARKDVTTSVVVEKHQQQMQLQKQKQNHGNNKKSFLLQQQQQQQQQHYHRHHHRNMISLVDEASDDDTTSEQRTRKLHSWCGTNDPTQTQIDDAELVDSVWRKSKLNKQRKLLVQEDEDRRNGGGRGVRRSIQEEEGTDGNNQQTIEVLVCHHLIYPSDTLETNFKSEEDVLKMTSQIDVGFSSQSCCSTMEPWCNVGQCSVDTSIKFITPILDFLGPGPCITHTRDDDWYYNGSPDINSANELNIKASLKFGDTTTGSESNVLNIYHIPFGDPFMLGFATFPADYNQNPILDGVMMNSLEMDKDPALYGATLIHEVGHWMGLYHTFQGPLRGGGTGCTTNDGNGGDQVDDTSAAAYPNFDCPLGTDSCPEIDGVDPIHNWMDYTSVACQYEFTQGQMERMHAQWALYRDPGVNTETVIDIDGSEPTGQDEQQPTPAVETTFDLLIQGQKSTLAVTAPVDSTVFCTVRAEDGDVDLYMRAGEDQPDIAGGVYDCSSTNAGNADDACSSTVVVDGDGEGDGGTTGTIHIAMIAFKTSTGITLTCVLDEDGSLQNDFTEPPEPESTTTEDEDDSSIFLLEDGTMLELYEGMAANTQLQFSIVTATTGFVKCETWAFEEGEDVDLYVRLNEPVELNAGGYDCFQASVESYEVCKLDSVEAGSSVYASSYAFNSVSYVGVLCSSYTGQSAEPTIQLTSDIPSEPLSLRTYEFQDYMIETVAPDGLDVYCVLQGLDDGAADADLYLRYDEVPVLEGVNTAYDCFSEELGTSEECTVVNPGTSTVLYVRVSAFYTFEDAILTCTTGTVEPLDGDGDVEVDREDSSSAKKILPPPGAPTTENETLMEGVNGSGGGGGGTTESSNNGAVDLTMNDFEVEIARTASSSSSIISSSYYFITTSFILLLAILFCSSSF